MLTFTAPPRHDKTLRVKELLARLDREASVARRKFLPTDAHAASYLAQLAHGAAIGRVKIESAVGRSDGSAASYTTPERYELSLQIKSLDPLPCAYADEATTPQLDDMIMLAKRQLERVYAVLNPYDHEQLRKGEELMLFAGQMQTSFERRTK